MAGKIFVNYRRDDDPSAAARVRDGLVARFGKSSVFMDVDNLLAGQRFENELAKALAQCDVLLAVMGGRWMDLLKARAADDDRDYVREEIAEALRRGLIVVPVRVGREGQLPILPRLQDLPDDIRDLVHYQKHDVAHERFGRDIAELIEAITTIRTTNRPQRATPRRMIAVAASVFALACAAAYYGGISVPWPAGSPGVLGSAEDITQNAPKTVAVAVAPKAPEHAPAQATAAIAPPAQPPARCEGIEALVGNERRCLKPKDSFKDCPECPEMVVVPAGTFTMGSPTSEGSRSSDEGPQRRVTIAKPFAVSKFEVTFAEWDACVAADGCSHRPADEGWGRGVRPVINVSWTEVSKDYLPWLSRWTGKRYRLLAEAEWEFAARAGTTTMYATGPTIGTNQANFDGTYTLGGTRTKGLSRKQSLEVGSFAANTFGLYDMHGNVSEWVEDCYVDNYRSAPSDGRPITDLAECSHIARGGSWSTILPQLRVADRGRLITLLLDSDAFLQQRIPRSDQIGFRVARTLD
jgi:formylglycine-generating enzyme required for sulfatase activity